MAPATIATELGEDWDDLIGEIHLRVIAEMDHVGLDRANDSLLCFGRDRGRTIGGRGHEARATHTEVGIPYSPYATDFFARQSASRFIISTHESQRACGTLWNARAKPKDPT